MRKTYFMSALVGLCASSLLLHSSLAFAAANKDNAKAAPDKAAAQVLHIQDFAEGPLSVQFRYVNGSLHAVRFMNTGSTPIKLSVLEKSYILGAKDYIVLTPPNIEVLKVYHEPHVDGTGNSAANQMLSQRFKTESVYQLPKKQPAQVN